VSRPLFLSILAFGLLLVGLASARGEFMALAIPFVLYLLVGLWRGPEGLSLEIQRRLSAERTAPGVAVEVTVTVINRGGSVEELLLEDVLPPGLRVEDGCSHHLLSLSKGAAYSWTYTLSGPRGSYSLESLRARAADHFGVVRVVRTYATFGSLFVFPPVTRLRRVFIRPRETRVYAGSIPARAGGTGIEFFGVRGYQPGDPPGQINWRVSARHPQELYSNEYQQERVTDVAIILDGRERTNLYTGGHSLFEQSVLAAAALADAFIAQGNRVGLLVYSHFLGWTWPGYGKLQRERILQALAHAQPGSSQVFSGLEHLRARLFPAESQIVLISPLVADDYEVLVQLRARGYRVMVVSPDPVTFEQAYLPARPEVDLAARVIRMERELLIRSLRRAGLQVVNWEVSQPFDQVVRRSLNRQVNRGRP
jgi:uncharacterized protein (DUF58 family)